jgi:hypothetical protein
MVWTSITVPHSPLCVHLAEATARARAVALAAGGGSQAQASAIASAVRWGFVKYHVLQTFLHNLNSCSCSPQHWSCYVADAACSQCQTQACGGRSLMYIYIAVAEATLVHRCACQWVLGTSDQPANGSPRKRKYLVTTHGCVTAAVSCTWRVRAVCRPRPPCPWRAGALPLATHLLCLKE